MLQLLGRLTLLVATPKMTTVVNSVWKTIDLNTSRKARTAPYAGLGISSSQKKKEKTEPSRTQPKKVAKGNGMSKDYVLKPQDFFVGFPKK
jgi:hypothetical protein